jgi:Ca2+-binding RTX toxin-like protein
VGPLSPSSGIYLRDSVTAPGHVTLNVFDNIVSHAGAQGLFLDVSDPGTLTFHGDANDFYANGDPNILGGHHLGSHGLTVSPGYVDRSFGDLRLKSSSPVIDRGQACTSGGLINLDASGHGRLYGKNVDMGAYEHGSGSPTGKVQLGNDNSNTLSGTSGRDILCGFGGADTLKGNGGSDFLDGGSGADKLVGGSGGDRLLGGDGNDKLCARDGVHGNDVLSGGSGTDSGQRDPGDSSSSVEHTTRC